MDINWTTLLTSAGAPALAIVGRLIFSGREPGLWKRIKRHSDIYAALPDKAKAEFEGMMIAEAKVYATAQKRRATRTLDGGTLAALIFVGLLTAALTWAAIWAATTFWSPLWVLAGAIALFGALLLLVGVGQLWKYDAE